MPGTDDASVALASRARDTATTPPGRSLMDLVPKMSPGCVAFTNETEGSKPTFILLQTNSLGTEKKKTVSQSSGTTLQQLCVFKSTGGGRWGSCTGNRSGRCPVVSSPEV